MIHELLLALSGYPGSVFVWNKRNGLQVSQDLPFLHPSETSVLNRVCKLGTDYIRFSEFIEQYTGHVQQQEHQPSQLGQPGLHGIYLRAFCTGLDSMLQPYRQALLDLEQEFLADPHLSISHINYSLDQFQLLFPSVMVVVEQIKSQKIHGCQILETVHKHSCVGLPPVRTALEKILAVCHGVMYKQLSAWMLHGLLLDQYEEFFVKQGACSGSTPVQPEEEEEDLGIGGLTGKQLRELQDLRLIEEENMLAPSLKQFSLRAELLPSYIPVRVAEKILFVGESVQMFENQNVTPTRSGSILKNQEDMFATELHRLKQQPVFSLLDFENLVDKIRSTVAEHLWKLMVEESDLLGQLKIIKDFYLLGRGELFQAFIDIAQVMLNTPPSAVTEHDVNVALQQSAHKVLLDDDNILPLLHLTIDYPGKDHKDASQGRDMTPREAPASGWAALGLSYKVQWPLHTLFTPAVLEKYNVMFKYLLSVRRVQAELQHCWALQMQRKHLKSNNTDAVKWRLRNHMAFLVDNLQYYLQVDVLESQFSQLLQQINATRDFESIRLAHDHFLSNLLAQSFILLKPVFHCLNEILDLCHNFCSLVNQNLGPLDERGAAQLDILVKGFSRQSSLLFKILSSVRNHQINPDLAQLLLRLDYNKYYTQAGGTLGSFGV
ncbi:gamma-tubulin complex component 4 isoform X2 [Protopterus annectens]|uniref:gamma-tubulin complex component 4 isoform X1 n=1 Tax=Protopterus annectens TaxID=7888 RepID=UPI001CFAFED5|nr:gamma-tubulin complex component 4 isoform X1 [Protopterus annectens]XP_043933473.1 gamma-tubulin complex component 4 isoform X2 [Protopterus annectens]